MSAPVLDLSPDERTALDTARRLAAAGIPVFVAQPDPINATGYALPRNWQHTAADPSVVDQWRPGMAIAAVTGHGIDVVDVDPRNGAEVVSLNGRTPRSYGAALTPSGGVHSFIASLGVRKKSNVLPGIDLQAGAPDGTGRGFVFLAPTVRVSKLTGTPTAYRWALPLDLDAWRAQGPSDVTGFALAELVRATSGAGNDDTVSPEDFMKAGPWANIEATLAEGRNNGVARLAAALRGRGGWRVEDAIRYMAAEVWPLIDQAQGGHPFSLDEFEAAITAQWRQYPDGAEQRAAEAAIEPVELPGGYIQAPPAARYFGEKNVFQAATLAADIASLGPLAQGRDDTLWAYRGGVWRQDKHIVRNRAVFLLGERYRPSHKANCADIVLSLVPSLDCEPIPDLINVRNGLLDWRTGALRPHTAEIASTVQLNVTWNPSASCPAFEQFVSEVVAPDVVETVWELVGYLMYSGNPLHKAVMLTGTGRNGKGTFLHVVEELLGRANITSVTLHSLVTSNFAPASLFGKLANIAGDIDPTYVENTAVLKAVTGGDTISAEHKFRDRFDFRPWAVPVFSANKIPGSADTTIGYLSRWLVLNFPHDFTGREDRHLRERLVTPGELSGIAVRGLAALEKLLERGEFELSESTREARDEFVRRVDQVRTWIFDCAEIADDAPWLPRTELYQAYQRWAARDGQRWPVKAADFYDRIEAAGAVPAKVHGTRGFNRIRIVDQGHSFMLGAAGAAPRAPIADQEPTQLPPGSNPVDTGVSAELGGTGADSSHLSSRARARTHTYEGKCEGAAPLPPSESAKIAARLLEHTAPKPRRTKIDPAERAAAKAAAKQAELEARLAEAAGPSVALPAAVTRDGTITSVTLDEAGAVARTFEFDRELTVDVETTGFPIGHTDYGLRTIQLGNEHVALVLDASQDAQLEAAGEILRQAQILHAHSASADLVPLDVAGVLDYELGWARMHDTVIPALLADPASTGSDADGLKQLAGDVLPDAVSPDAEAARAALFKAGRWLTDTKATTPRERSGWAQADPACTTMVRYAAADVLDAAALARVLPVVLPALLERERTAQRMTARVAHRGLRLDGDHVAAQSAEHRPRLAEAAEKIRAFGIDNPGSDQQVAARLLELGAPLPRTKTGRPSVAKAGLDPLRKAGGPVGELVRARLDYQHHETVLSTFLEPYAQLVERGDGRARPTVYTLGAETGRMSCVRPNLQQVPREGGMRACITADPGTLLVSADFAGVELRVAAALSGDRNLAAMIAAGVDVHWEIARLAFGPEATKTDRYAVKRGVFGRIYGGGVAAIARGVGVPETTAAAIIAALDTMLPELTAWSAAVRASVKSGQTQFPSYAGRTIHLPRAFPHKAPNYAIQGTARELLVDALIRLEATRWAEATLLPVHDELLMVIPEAEAAEATAALVAAMETELHGVPIVAEASRPAFAWQDAA